MNLLIVGGTGTFGKAFARKALDEGIERICIYSRSEWTQAQMRAQFNDDQRLRWFIGDVRDRDRLVTAMQGIDAVIHAAALKRIEVGHYSPTELIKTNVTGTTNVVEAAFIAKVSKAVLLSTDKAVLPVSPYGQSKALAESIFLNANRMHVGPKYAVVRYGNVWGSTGSVVPRWRELIAHGHDSVPITDPDCTRFFMLPEEAVDLVWQTLRSMHGGELVIPDWLPAYRLGDLAAAMGVKTHPIGLPEWEKKHEAMREGCTSDRARRMSINEIQQHLR